MDIMGLLGGGLLGTITGLAGNALTALTTYKTQKLKLEEKRVDHEHELLMAEQTRENMRIEASMAIEVQKSKTEGDIELSEIGAYTASLKHADTKLFAKGYMQDLPQSVRVALAVIFGLVDVLKATTRPVLTYFQVGVCTWLTAMVYMGNRTAFVAAANVEMLVYTIVYLAATSYSWWFADRRTSKNLMRMMEKG